MRRTSFRLLRVLVVAIACVLLSGLLAQVVSADAAEQQALVDKSRITFQRFMRDESLVWLHENLPKAKGLLIVPSLLKGGFILGGSGGSGVLIARDEKTGKWSQPGFYTIGSVTFGLQIGGEAAEVIMVVRTQNALENLYTTDFKLGGDTSVAAGPVGVGAKANVVADIVSFSKTKGAYAGVSLEGSVIKVKGKWNEAYYGKAVRPIDIFVRHTVSNKGSAELRKAVGEAERKKK